MMKRIFGNSDGDAPTASADAPALADAAKSQSLWPLWESYGDLIRREPAPVGAPVLWRYQDVRRLLERAGREVSTKQAERRVLLFKNPGLDKPFATHTIAAGMQYLGPEEKEGSHRHSQAAIRLVVEGSGGYTSTDGERIWMNPGDFITTPSWTFHDHANESRDPLIWLDGIDVPLVNHWALTFSEYLTEGDRMQPITRPPSDSHYRFGSGLLPIDHNHNRPFSPIYSYPYERTREILDKLARSDSWDQWHGIKLKFANPLNGGHVTPTIGAFVQFLAKGLRTQKYRSTDSVIYSVIEGHGAVLIGDQRFQWSPGDVFVVPNWTFVSFEATDAAVIFSFSDRAAQENLGLWREERSPD